MFDVFFSYRHADADAVRPVVQALRETGLQVWIDESGIEDFASIQRGIEDGLDNSKALLAWYSARYPESLACQWELTRAFLAGQDEGDPRRRVLLLNPEATGVHIHPIELRDALYRVAGDADARRASADAVARHVRSLTTTFGQLTPRARPRWFGAAAGDGSNRFVGRLPELWAIHSGMGAVDVPIIQSGESRPLVCVSGIAGSGKSLTAETYGIRFGSAYPGGIFWLKAFGHDAEHVKTADERESLLEGLLIDFAVALGLDTQNFSPAQVRERLAGRIGQQGTYLWVVDDLPSGLSWTEAQPWLAPTTHGKTLITTRGDVFTWAGAHVTLNELDETAAFALLTHRRKPESDEEAEDARRLVRDLGFHALALELAAVAIEKRGFAAFGASLDVTSRDVLDFAASLLVAQGEQLPHRENANLALSTTLSLSIDGLPEPAKDVLRLAAQLAPAPVSARLLVLALMSADNIDEEAAQDAADLAVAMVSGESLAREPSPGNWLVHSLVSRTMRFRDTNDTRRHQLRQGAVVALDGILVNDALDLRHHGQLGDAVTHARVLLASALAGTDQLDPYEGRVLDSLYAYDFLRGNYKDARRVADRLIDNCRRVMGPEHRYTFMFMNYVGNVLRAQGDLPGARAAQEQLLETRGRVLGETDPDTIRSLSDVALTLSQQGDLARARALQERVLQVRREVLGVEHVDTATAMNNLAATLAELGETSDAIPLEEQAVKIRQRLLGSDHLDTLSAMRNLAVMRRSTGGAGPARELQAQVAGLSAPFLDEEHPDNLTALNNLAATLHSQGDLPGARAAAERCLDARTRVLGGDHPDTLATMNNLGAILVGLGNFDRARALLERSRDRCRQVLGPTHPQTFKAAYHLVVTLTQLKDTSTRIREVVAQDLAPLATRDPASLPPELREVRTRLLPMIEGVGGSGEERSTPWWRRRLF